MDRPIDLNADLGEEITDDSALLEIVTSANVACGYHAGNEQIMRKVCQVAARLDVAIGAQVSYADRANFGRVALDVPFDILREQVAHQVRTLSEIATGVGAEVRYLKPHGALYHRVLDDEEQAFAVLDGSGDLPVLGMPGVLLDAAAAAGRTTLLEGFPDRDYTPQGRLRPRDQPGAVIEESDRIAARAVELAPRVDSVCVHGDTPGAVGHARAVRAALQRDGWELRHR